MSGRSINNVDTNWRQEWEDEQRLTPQEKREEDALRREEEALNAMIMQDLRLLELEREQEEDEEWRQIEQRCLSNENLVESLYREYDGDYDDPVC